ncbi:MAG: glycosyltransferase family 39 protein [Dehalococcoidia bacterium]
MSVAGEARRLPLGASALPAAQGVSLGRILLIGAICAIPVVLYILFFMEPFMRDEGFYAATAQIMLDGGVPYRDAFDNKPPLIFVWYAISFLMFGENVWAPRLLVSLLLSLTTLLIYFEGRLLFSHRAAVCAALAFALSMGLAVFETNANTEYFMLLPLTGAVLSYTLAERRDDDRLYGLAGALAGISILTKETSLFVLFLFMALSAHKVWRDEGWRALAGRTFFRRIAWLNAGCAFAGIVVALPFVLTGTFDEMFDAIVLYTLDYVGRVSSGDRLVAIAKMPLYLFWLAGPLAVFSYLGMARLLRERSDQAYLLVGWVIVTFLGVLAAGRFSAHYYVMALPVLALIVPAGLSVLQRAGRIRRQVLVSLAAVSIIPMVVLNAQAYLQPTAAERHEAKYSYNDFSKWETESAEFAEWLKQRTSPNDYIYNLGFQSELYFYSDRKSPTPYLFYHPFIAGQEHVDAALADLKANPPLFVIDSATYEKANQFTYYPQDLMAWVRGNYDYLGKMFYADVYRLKDGSGGN